MIVFTYQGDGDLASIGTNEIIHAANRGEKFTTIFVNNAIYGMTGGQMAPTTLSGQVTTTCPAGRNTDLTGQPLRVSEMLATLATQGYVERVAVHTPFHIIHAKKAIRQAFAYQKDNVCFSLVEVLSTCPTNWGITPEESVEWVDKNLKAFFPLGCYKKPDEGGVDS